MTYSKNLWGGRFTEGANETFAEFNNSFGFDRRLFGADIRASIAHCKGLFHAGVLTRLESQRIKNGLETLLKRADFDKNYFDENAEDVHSFIEAKLVHLIGDTGRKLHTGRSRNDQVAKCEAGLASACAVRIDSVQIEEVIGTIAGDDTIFIAVRGQKDQKEVLNDLRSTNDSLLTTKTNEIMKILTVTTFSLLPATLIGQIFGMNTKVMPIIGWRYDFWIILSMMIFVGVVTFLFFRSKKWL